MSLIPAIFTVLSFLFFVIGELTASSLFDLIKPAYHEKLKNISLCNTNKDEYFPFEKVNFYFFNRTAVSIKIDLDNYVSLMEHGYDPNIPTKIVVHGYLGNYFRERTVSMVFSILLSDNVNVILVDWGGLIDVDYFYAAKQSKYIGDRTAHLIDLLVWLGTKLDDVHLIGHSLGAHIAGFAGAAVEAGKVGRITGLDPAKPCFHHVTPADRLDHTDAKFVDCIHTCSGILGLEEPICTADFYPNGGYNIQPGCHFYDFGRCSHLRSFEYFMESINPSYRFPAFRCPSIPKYDWSNCEDVLFDMGYHTSVGAEGIYFTVTNDRSPYSPLNF